VGLFWLFILSVIVQCEYALYMFIRIFGLRPGKPLPPKDRRPVSIIICAKNEAQNLAKNLPAILSQKYDDEGGKPLFEVIVVNDASTDNTADVLQRMELQYDNLWDVVINENTERNLQGKKFALSKGVAYAKYDWLLLTDADCTPASDEWLPLMASPLAEGKEIVAGYGGYSRAKGLLNAFTRWETLHTFLQYSTYSSAGKPYMAVGRNLACTKEILLKAQQAEVWNLLPSGDDDLLVSVAGNRHNTAVVTNKKAFTYSGASDTWKKWISQKQRHLSTGKYYKANVKFLLGMYAVSHAALWICFFTFLLSFYWKTALVLMAVRCFLYWIIWTATAVKLEEANLIYFFPFFDIAWMVYNFAFLPYITWKNKTLWK
jgi:glycosyltransferase involved in cell wall biosynthesis